MTADFGNFVTKTDKKQKTKDEMNPALKLLKHKKKNDGVQILPAWVQK